MSLVRGDMESEIEHLSSEHLESDRLKQQIEIIKRASDLAQSKIDYDSAHNPQVLRSIEVIEGFLRKKHRICYGGQAINAYLPTKYKFYDPEYSIPDYDFFTPSQMSDLQQIASELTKAGFTEIAAREGMHEGTIKIYVDYIPVADLTAMDGSLFRSLAKKAQAIDGISYIDPDSLRMLMYLELSRPRGEVSRWSKVYERMMLFNEFVPIQACKRRPSKLQKNVFSDAQLEYTRRYLIHNQRMFAGGDLIPFYQHAIRKRSSKLQKNVFSDAQLEYTLRYLIQNQRMFAGGDLLPFYQNAIHKKSKDAQWILSSRKPIIFLSPDPKLDANQLLDEYHFLEKKKTLHIKTFYNQGLDVMPSIYVIHRGSQPLVFIIEQTSCHSYINLPLRDGALKGGNLMIASMDTLITLYFSLGFVSTSFFDKGAMSCLANELVHISIQGRRLPPDQFVFPFVSLRCVGYQTSLPSLIKAKLKRMTPQKKQDLRDVLQRGIEQGSKRNRPRKTQKRRSKRYL